METNNLKEIDLKVSGFKAFLKTSITYGEHQDIENVLMSQAKGQVDPSTKQFIPELKATAAADWAFAKLLVLVNKIQNREGGDIPVTKESLRALPMDDGKQLEREVDEILGEKKS